MNNLELSCPHCNRPINDLKSVSAGAQPELGSVFLCGDCAGVSIFAPNQEKRELFLRPMLESEFLALDVDEKRDLSFAVRQCVAIAMANRKSLATQHFIQNHKN